MASNLRITDEDIARYQRDGALLLKGVLEPASVTLLETGVEEVYRERGRRYTSLSSASGEGETSVREYVTQDSPSLRSLLESGVIGEIGAVLMQTPSAQLVLDQVFYKRKGPIVPTPWHQDTPFLRVRGHELIRLWFPCDCSPRRLTVQVVRGSHRWNVVYNTAGEQPNETMIVASASKSDRNGVGDALLPPAPDIARYRESFDILTWDVDPGDVIAFQGNMLHGAEGHPGHDRPRRAFAVMLGGPNLRYHAPKGKAFPAPGKVRGIKFDPIPDGAPIGNHQEAFPVCWRTASVGPEGSADRDQGGRP
jgi:ectoine hydroxylase-related dioxygenase (phytanoyl-CoA dioxygenase family)